MNKKSNEENVLQISVPGDLRRELKAIAVMFNKNTSELDREAFIIGAKQIIEAYHTGQRGKRKGNHNIIGKRGVNHGT